MNDDLIQRSDCNMHEINCLSSRCEDDCNTGNRRERRWGYEIWLLVLIVAALYLPRLDTLGLRGEESRRAQIGIEMLRSGDYFVPRQQGVPFLSRPPLQNWIILALGGILGDVDVWAVRLPSVLSLLGVVLLIYGYSRTFLSRFASFTAAVAFASMPQVMELGRLGETEMMFTLFVAASLLIWHWGFSCRWPATATWTSAYFCVALGTLTKGPQAPAYFAAAVGLFLIVKRQWRFALSRAHLAGIAVFLIVWGAWQVPFAMELGFAGVRDIYAQDVGFRFADTSLITIVGHLLIFPLEILFGCMLPWSLLLLPYINPNFRSRIATARDNVTFLTCTLIATFPTVWLVPGGHPRYLLPIYPCFAPLIGLVVERCISAQNSYVKTPWPHWWQGPWQLWWRHWLTIMSVGMVAVGLCVAAVTAFGDGDPLLAQPPRFAVVYFIATVILAFAAIWARDAASHLGKLVAPVAIALFMGLTFVGVFTNSLAARNPNTAASVADVRRSLPTAARLVSLGYVHHLFAFYYEEPIPMVEIADTGAVPPPESEYFCFHNQSVSPSRLKFNYKIIAVVPCYRFHTADSGDVVTVARRLGAGD